MLLCQSRRKGPSVVAMLHSGMVLVSVSVNVGELAADGVKNGFGGARVPFLAARAGEEVSMGFSFDQQQHLYESKDFIAFLLLRKYFIHSKY